MLPLSVITRKKASSDVQLQYRNTIYQFIVIDSVTTVHQTHTVASGASSVITMTTQVYSSSSSPFELSNKYVMFSAVANAVTSTTPSYMSPSSNYNSINPLSFDTNNDTCDSVASFDSNHDPPSFDTDKHCTNGNYGLFGRVTTTTPLHIINHMSLVYLILL